MRSKIFRRRRRFDRGCGCGGTASRACRRKQLFPLNLRRREGWPSFLTAPHSHPLLRFSAVNDSLSYSAICFPDDTVCFFFQGRRRGGELLRRSRYIPLASIPNPRVKCNLTTLLHASTAATAAGSPLNVRFFFFGFMLYSCVDNGWMYSGKFHRRAKYR